MKLRLLATIAAALALVACASNPPRARPAASGPAAAPDAAASGSAAPADAPVQGGVAAPPPSSAGAPPVDLEAQARIKAMVAAAGQAPPVPDQPPVTGIPACDRYTAALVAAMRCAPDSDVRARLAGALDEVIATIHDVPANKPEARALVVDGCTAGAAQIEDALAGLSCGAAR